MTVGGRKAHQPRGPAPPSRGLGKGWVHEYVGVLEVGEGSDPEVRLEGAPHHGPDVAAGCGGGCGQAGRRHRQGLDVHASLGADVASHVHPTRQAHGSAAHVRKNAELLSRLSSNVLARAEH